MKAEGRRMKDEWKTMPLGGFAESVDYGVTASATEQPLGPKFLRITDIQDGAVNWGSVPWCECDARSASDARLKAGDIVFARTGATTGKSFLIRDCPTDAVFASYLIRVRVGTSVEPRFVSHFFQTENYWAQVAKGARGVAQPGVNATTLKALQIPLPPLAEQRRIAEVLDRAEALRAKRRAALAQLDSLTQSLFLDLFGDPYRNPKKWPQARLDGVCGLVNGRAFKPEEWETEGLPIIRIQNLNDPTKPFNYTRQSLPEKVRVRTGDILFSWSGTPGTSFGCFRWSGPEGWLNQHIFDVRLNGELDGEFFICQLNLKLGELIGKAHGGVGLQHVTKGMVDETMLLVPPIPLQREFARRVRAVEALKTAQRALLAELDALFATLQHRAFKGEL